MILVDFVFAMFLIYKDGFRMWRSFPTSGGPSGFKLFLLN